MVISRQRLLNLAIFTRLLYDAKCMSSKKSMVLGYTRSGLAVDLPIEHEPDLSNFDGWSRGDHFDASRILMEHGEREQDQEVGSWCINWGRAHHATAKSSRRARIRGAAETIILSGRRR